MRGEWRKAMEAREARERELIKRVTANESYLCFRTRDYYLLQWVIVDLSLWLFFC